MKQRFGKQTGVVSRSCSKCGGDLGDRYGKQRYCKACHAANMRATRPKHSELSPEARKKANTRAYSRMLVLSGVIKKTPCVVCGDEKSERHHPDYDKPREVIWLCRRHHLELHEKDGNKKGQPNESRPFLNVKLK